MSEETDGSDAPADGEYLAVLDRFEGNLAVLLLEADAETVGDLAVPRERLPDDARRVDAVLRVVVEDERLVDARYDGDETEERAERAQSRFDRLSRRLGDEKGSDEKGGDEGETDAEGDERYGGGENDDPDR